MSEFVQIDLPEGSVLEHSITVASFVNADGQMSYSIQSTGEAHVTSVVGLLELAKSRILSSE